MNDKYIAERLAILESKLDLIIENTGFGIGQELLKSCPVCKMLIKYTIATDGAPVRKCGCSTGIVPVDVNSYIQPQPNNK